MTDDRVTRWPPSARPKAIPVRRAPAPTTQPVPVTQPVPTVRPAPSVSDAYTEELPVMTDDEFEAAIEAAQRAKAEREAEVSAEAGAAASDAERAERAAPKRRSLVAGSAGALTAATVLIAAIAIAAQVISGVYGKPGPGWLDVAGQTVLAILAVLQQRRVDRRARRGWAVLGVVLMTVLSFGVFWWAWLWLFWSV